MNDEIKVQVIAHNDRKTLRLRWRDPITNKFKYKSAKTSNREKAQRAAGKLEDEIRSGRYQAGLKMTWQGFRERLETEYYPNIAKKTQGKVDTAMDAIERLLNPQRLADVTNDKLSYFASQLRVEQKGEGEEATLARGEATVAGYIRHTIAALRWAYDLGLLHIEPKASRAARGKIKSNAKGRAVSLEEFERMLSSATKGLTVKDYKRESVTPSAALVETWQFFLRGLWLSGFRLGEALRLSWDDVATLHVDTDGRRPVVRIPEGCQKSGKAETWACPPDFAALLAEVPERDRRGRVFKVETVGSVRPTEWIVMRTLARIGQAAGVVVSRSTDGKVKYASAHDLRRSFCTRWARMVMPQVLTRMARHHSIQTTMAYYVTQSAEDTADAAYEAFAMKNGGKVPEKVPVGPIAPTDTILNETQAVTR